MTKSILELFAATLKDGKYNQLGVRTAPDSAGVGGLLASRWDEFVDCERRMHSLGPVLQRVLKAYRDPTVLDAAAGMGCESIWLANRGYDVVSNEISEEFRRLSIRRSANANISLSFTSVDWRNIANVFRPGAFNVVLLLGNSLCLLMEEDDRRMVCKAIHDVCSGDGTLIVDERNFDYILNSRTEILRGRFRFSGKVMYCGKRVIGCPSHIDDNRVRFAYRDSKTAKVLGTLDMHPFRQGELCALLKDSGFRRIERLSDLERTFNSEADFYTYICTP